MSGCGDLAVIDLASQSYTAIDGTNRYCQLQPLSNWLAVGLYIYFIK